MHVWTVYNWRGAVWLLITILFALCVAHCVSVCLCVCVRACVRAFVCSYAVVVPPDALRETLGMDLDLLPQHMRRVLPVCRTKTAM